MTIDESYRHFVKQLRSIYDERETNNIADWVFESIAKTKRLDRVVNKQQAISSTVSVALDNAMQQLLQHKPVQYVLGEAWFYKMKLKVNEHVLIPRPETEELVEWVVEVIRNKPARMTGSDGKSEIRNEKVEEPAILDVGTGSGCIPIALKKELPDAGIFAIDISKHALAVAEENAKDQNVKIDFLQLDFLNEQSWTSLPTFTIIISNPPYIPENEKGKLAKNVADHEPPLALFVNDKDPFIFYRKVAAFAGTHLKEKGQVFVEVHEDYANEVQQIFADKKYKTEIRKDIYDRERMIKAYR